PITSIILGAVFLGETMGLVQYIGGGLIIIGVILTEKYD
ncbi:MAG TPA: EamA family transporter, partial [Clostridiales bacterium]|nr:EamA family transporter [Clostridiales bacterium]